MDLDKVLKLELSLLKKSPFFSKIIHQSGLDFPGSLEAKFVCVCVCVMGWARILGLFL